ncbi:hypothetical protein Ate02nite_39130 [Paractinoplanes tereljensis]|uniref:Uncharacterized protein n=1 Tax=Paractinoplanes tereljensis TaxID=571912 RepID=A0A919TSA5_9ACTN|nr:hypothetical protein Ate02nite_39130 [Actinoplanes tereljensis]
MRSVAAAFAGSGAACAVAGNSPASKNTPAVAAPTRRVTDGTDNGLKVKPLSAERPMVAPVDG